jgi:hypothetical protein
VIIEKRRTHDGEPHLWIWPLLHCTKCGESYYEWSQGEIKRLQAVAGRAQIVVDQWESSFPGVPIKGDDGLTAVAYTVAYLRTALERLQRARSTG